jgi:hypothetical protein
VAQDVNLPVMRTNFEEDVFGPVPLIQYFLNQVIMPVQSKTKWSLIRLAA